MKFIPRWLRDNFRIKAGLFILATLLWFLVVTQRNYEHLLTIPIQIAGLRPGKVIVNEIPTEAEVTFRAQGKELVRLRFFSEPFLNLDLTTIKHFYTFRPRPEMVIFTGGLDAEVIDVFSPDSIEVVLGDRLEFKLPISPRITAEPADGYTFLGDFEIKPSSVQVIGPRSKIVRLESIMTDSVSMRKVKRKTELQLNLVIPDIYGIEVIPPQVKVLIRVERLGERTIKRVPLKVTNVRRGYEVITDPVFVDVRVSGGISVIADLTPDSIGALVNSREYDVRQGEGAPVHLKVPERVEVKAVFPKNVRLIVRRK
ncbi:YbbR-like domain-containing protein [bacterium]|nr:YbbR-like domain-containing protein [bacterium]